MSRHVHSYIALGDSYTIGESLPLHDNFPYQTIQFLRQRGLHFYAPEIVAKTGWTTSELAEHLLHHKYNEHYDFATLLIGVNNQYRSQILKDYTTDFDFLLRKAIRLVHDKSNHVIVLSIPDWGHTPFAYGRDMDKISKEIDKFNEVNKKIAQQYQVNYLEITKGTRLALDDKSLLTTDQLHYSSLEYGKWADKVAFMMSEILKHKLI